MLANSQEMQKLNILQRLGPGLRGYFEEVIQLTMVCQFSASTRRPFGPNKAVHPFNQLQTVLDKLQLLLEHFAKIKNEFDPSCSI
jgi:hypothetical protein